MSKKLKQIDEILFYIIVEGFLVYGVAMELIENPGWLFTYPYLLLIALALVKICIQGNGWQEWLLSLICIGIAFLSYRGSGDRASIPIALCICCSKNVRLDRFIQIDLIVRIITAFLYILLPFTGVIQNHINDMSTGRARTFFGWFHPNGMGKCILLICMEWVYLRHGRFRWYDYAGILILVMFLDMTANSRAAEVVMILMLVWEICLSFVKNNKWKSALSTWIAATSLTVSTILPIIAVAFSEKYYKEFYQYLGNIGSRFILTWKYVAIHGITLWGAPYTSGSDEYLDMLFANISLFRGLVFGAFIWGLSAYSIYYAYNKKNEKYLLLLFVFFAYGMMESEHINMIYAFFPILLGIPAFDTAWKQGKTKALYEEKD